VGVRRDGIILGGAHPGRCSSSLSLADILDTPFRHG